MTSTPHDAFVRAIFGQPQHAATELAAVLPNELLRELDLSTLAPCPGSFVDEALRDRHADLLFEVRVIDGAEALVYILLEHQSTFDPWLPLRLLEYQLRIWERWRSEHPEARKLPPIVPVVLHHGERPWPASTRFADLIGMEGASRGALVRHVVNFEFMLDDLARQPDEALLARAMQSVARLALLALKHARTSADLESRLLRWIELVAGVLRTDGGGAALALVQRYILEVSAHVQEEFFEGPLAKMLPNDLKETIVTTGQQLIERGRQAGLKEGRAEQLVGLLKHRFGDLPANVREHITAASTEQLDTWAIRMLDARSLADVFGALPHSPPSSASQRE